MPTTPIAVACLAVVGLEISFCWVFVRGTLQNVVMVFLLGVVVAALRAGRIASVATAVASVGAIDFFFTEPRFSFDVADRGLVLTFFVFLVVAYVIADLTERARRATAEMLAKRLEAQNEWTRSAVLSAVSHDLRTPLAVLVNASNTLLDQGDRLPSDRRREHLTAIAEESCRLSRLVRHLVDAASIESGSVHVRKEWVPLEEIVGVALARLADTLSARHVDVWIDPAASLVPVDGTLLEQVFMNLLENAAKHTPVQSRVAISARTVVDGVEVAVADSGHGVPPGLEERIFDKFERGHRSTGGLGLGLAICRGIVDAHGGRIWCDRGESRGATFRFVLPRSEQPPIVTG